MNVNRFVSAIHIPNFSPTSLLSGGGDPTIKLWDWMSGKEQAEIQIQEFVEPFIIVLPTTQEKANEPRRRNKRGKGKDKQQAETVEELKMETMDTLQQTETMASVSAPQKTLVVHKISTIVTDNNKFVVFSVVGYASLRNMSRAAL